MPAVKQENMDKLTANNLRRLVIYDPESGIFTWRVRVSNCQQGQILGRKVGNYFCVSIDRTRYYLHRLAWLYMAGQWPVAEIDHIEGFSNRWSNLREATSGQNKANKKVKRTSVLGVKGVCRTPARSKKPYEACVGRDGQKIWRDRFDTIEEASVAYAQKAAEIHGEFARIA